MHYIPAKKNEVTDLTENSLYFELYSKEEQDLLFKLNSSLKNSKDCSRGWLKRLKHLI